MRNIVQCKCGGYRFDVFYETKVLKRFRCERCLQNYEYRDGVITTFDVTIEGEIVREKCCEFEHQLKGL